MNHPLQASIVLPDWWLDAIGDGIVAATAHERMAFAIALANRNVAEQTGGPFAAAIFDLDSGRLIAAGVNVVVACSMAIAHAEMVAIAMAGRTIGNHDLAAAGRTELVATTEPCAMCLGAVGWSGVVSLLCGAREEDATAVGFDEGVKPQAWIDDLAAAGIEVTRDVLRDEAAAVLRLYVASGGVIYNGRAALDSPGEVHDA